VSDPYPFTGDSEPADPAPSGDVGWDGDNADQAPPEPQRSYLELDDDVANRYVRVKVDGQDEEVPLREALSGYSRTADYTRKTQELAQQRQQAEYALTLERALQSQPAETLRILAQQYGVEFGQQAAPQAPSYEDEYENPYTDPTEPGSLRSSVRTRVSSSSGKNVRPRSTCGPRSVNYSSGTS